jgi:hypothetical protein
MSCQRSWGYGFTDSKRFCRDVTLYRAQNTKVTNTLTLIRARKYGLNI